MYKSTLPTLTQLLHHHHPIASIQQASKQELCFHKQAKSPHQTPYTPHLCMPPTCYKSGQGQEMLKASQAFLKQFRSHVCICVCLCICMCVLYVCMCVCIQVCKGVCPVEPQPPTPILGQDAKRPKREAVKSRGKVRTGIIPFPSNQWGRAVILSLLLAREFSFRRAYFQRWDSIGLDWIGLGWVGLGWVGY